ncbi:hypothetical protein SBOR_2793 [Sclerotinia borealis F-4128]|uniref:FAD-binding FR-type domain-containing protein n=1 Tax=Sclerotinia borealis (strain F-4128) TaxID=1432307 RepID=W9CJ86_SCLBF|nr:hypothetical protein SBOR_2793 [Sclerotinia borealis F-4128]
MNTIRSHFSLSEWMYDTLRGVTFNTSSHISSIDNPKPKSPKPDDNQFQKLIDGALFNEKIINTYPLAILGIVLILSVVHWSGEIIRWRKRALRRAGPRYSYDLLDDEPSKTIRDDVTEHSGVSSPGSSTLGSITPPLKPDGWDEYTPLLHRQNRKSLESSRSTITSRIKAFLIYQPRPIPYFNKVLPSNGSSLFILSFLALNLFYTFYNIPFTTFEASVLGDRAGLVFAVNLPLLYILGAKNQPLKLLIGVSYESLNIIHRRLGELMMFEALIHAGGMFVMWYTILKPFRGWTLFEYLSHPCIYLGLSALFTYKLLYVTSLASFRQRWYELFLGLHVVLQAAALTILYFHHRGAKTSVGLALSIFIVDRLVFRIGTKSIMAEANVSVFEDNETILMTFHLPKSPSNMLSQTLGHSISSGWHATDHIFLTIPSLGSTHALQAHPFTIASPAPLLSSQTSKLSLLIRARDGFSADLLRAAHIKKTLKCRLDGPYGSSHARNLLEDSDLAIMVAGGSGIAVKWPIVHHLLDLERDTKDAENGAHANVRRRRIVLVWIIHEGSHLEWIGAQERQEMENQGVEIIIPGATSEVGRPDLEGMMEGIVRGWGCGKEGRIRRKIGVVVSGPDGLNRTVNNKCAEFVKGGRNLKIAVEKFGW